MTKNQDEMETLTSLAQKYLDTLCLEIQGRRTGSPGNRAAVDFFAERIVPFGFETSKANFECLDWVDEGAALTADSETYTVHTSPFSNGGVFTAELKLITTIEELEKSDLRGKIGLLRDEIAKEQLMPKNFTFYNPEHHQHIYQLLENKQPLAIIAATSQDPDLAGAIYPFPLIEDGDFNIPSVFMTEEEGQRLAKKTGATAHLEIHARRIPSTASNILARLGDPSRRVVICAHIDAKEGSPGALDNASGIVVLLLLGELLEFYSGNLGIEILAINGEDYYSAPGEMLYLAQHRGQLDQILLAINLDGVGYKPAKVAYSFYNLPDNLESASRNVFSNYPELTEGEPWFQGDHMIFILNQRPAIALTSDSAQELAAQIIHTSKDKPDLVDPEKLVQSAMALRDLILSLEKLM